VRIVQVCSCPLATGGDAHQCYLQSQLLTAQLRTSSDLELFFPVRWCSKCTTPTPKLFSHPRPRAGQMGRFRWISKPFKRWAFQKGESMTAAYSWRYVQKYVVKYIRLHEKMGGRLSRTICAHRTGRIAACAADLIIPEARGNKERPGYGQDELCEKVAAAAGEHLAEEENGLPAEEQARAEWLRELADYAVSLGAAVDKNMGLDHSKVREYWLDRGPRLAATAVIFFVFAMVCQSNNQPSDSWAH